MPPCRPHSRRLPSHVVSWTRGFLAACCLALPLVGQEGRQQVSLRDQLRQIAERRDVQTELPGEKTPTERGRGRPERTPRNSRTPDRRLEPRNPSSSHSSSNFSGLGGLAKFLAWGLVATVVVLLVVAIVRALAERRLTAAKASPAKVPLPVADAPVAPPLADYELLAQAGRFAEAVHALLLHAFVRLATRRSTGWPAAKTGREILAAVGGFTAADEPLQIVFRTAETAWFGKAAVDRAQYEKCLQNFVLWSTA